MFGNSYFGQRYFGDKYFGAANENTVVVNISGSAAGTSATYATLTFTGRRKGGGNSTASAAELQRIQALQYQIEEEDVLVMSFITTFLASRTADKGTNKWHH